jgi:biopolymer transport protein ExbD
MQLGGSGSIKSDINVTPLVDVMLVLLIIVMIVAPLLQQGAPLKLPQANFSTEKPDTADQTVLSITQDKNIYLNSLPVAKGELRRRVQDALENRREKIVIIKADENVEYGAVMDVMDELRASGIEDMGLITDPGRRLQQLQQGRGGE